MELSDLITRICKAVSDLQAANSRDAAPVSPDTCPIRDLDEFDSHNGLELTCALAEDYGLDVPVDENIFLDDQDRPLTIRQIAQRLNNMIPEQ